MGTKFRIFNQDRQSFLSLGVTLADTTLARLAGLIGRRRLRANEGIWVVPSHGIHTLGMLFPIDVVYLDGERRVIHLIENLAPFRVAPVRINAESVLELPVRTIFESETQVGDRLQFVSIHGSAAEALVAMYTNGGQAQSHKVRQVSPAGAYIVTGDRWYPGTIVNMVLREPLGASIRMRARLTEPGEDGVGVRFVYLNSQERRRFERFLLDARPQGGQQ